MLVDHSSAFHPPAIFECILLGGVGDITKCHPGVANDTVIKGPFRLQFQQDKQYLLRVINTSYKTGFVFSIDNHNLQVVSADFVPIHPYSTNAIRVNIGQRYNVIVKASPRNSTDSTFWIRTYSACGGITPPGPDYMKTGVISYGTSPGPDPTSDPWPEANPSDCKDEPLASIQPIVPWNPPGPSNSDVPRSIQFGKPPPDLPGLDLAISPETIFAPMQASWGSPTFVNLDNTEWSNLSVVVQEEFSAALNNDDFNKTSATTDWVNFVTLSSKS